MAGRPPYDKIRIGGNMQVNFWERDIQRGEEKITTIQPSISIGWRDKSTGEWKNRSISITMAQLYEFYATASKTHDVHQRFRTDRQRTAESAPADEDEAAPPAGIEKTEGGQMLFKEGGEADED